MVCNFNIKFWYIKNNEIGESKYKVRVYEIKFWNISLYFFLLQPYQQQPMWVIIHSNFNYRQLIIFSSTSKPFQFIMVLIDWFKINFCVWLNQRETFKKNSWFKLKRGFFLKKGKWSKNTDKIFKNYSLMFWIVFFIQKYLLTKNLKNEHENTFFYNFNWNFSIIYSDKKEKHNAMIRENWWENQPKK